MNFVLYEGEGVFLAFKYFLNKSEIVLQNILKLSLKLGILVHNNHLNLCGQVVSSKCSKNRCQMWVIKIFDVQQILVII